LALTYCQGKAIINSINLEDGEENSNAWCRLHVSLVRLWWSAASMKTSCRRKRLRGAEARDRAAFLQTADGKLRAGAGGHYFRFSGFSLRDGR